MNILSILLGGYFGSRLMKNIREDKGYTYGIYSRLQSYRHSGMFIIGTEVKAAVVDDAIKEIHKEIAILQKEKVSSGELEKVKNQASSRFIRGLRSTRRMASRLGRSELGLGWREIPRSLERMKAVTAQDVMDVAKKYFTKDNRTVGILNRKSEGRKEQRRGRRRGRPEGRPESGG